MTSVILVVGLLMAVGLAIVMVRPAWRLPALAFGLLAIPGNVDDLLPQMLLDPRAERDALAPVITSLDALLAWALILTVRERRDPGPVGRGLILIAIGLAVVGSLAIVAAVAGGVDLGPMVRGLLLWWRIPALLYLAFGLRHELGDGRLLGAAIVAGGVVLLGNGIYTTLTGELDRFTAKTFGRNGLSIALTVVTIVGTGMAASLWSRGTQPRDRWLAVGTAAVAGTALFGMSATGTRMAFLVLIVAGVAALLLYPGRLSRRALPGIVATLGAGVVILGLSIVLTTGGGRTVSVVTDPDTTVGVVTDPGSVPTETAIRSRGQFWSLALEMSRAAPLVGVGPFQWNVVRYDLDPEGPVVVADAHQTYLQVAAEYGLPTLVMYLVLLGACVLVLLPAVVRPDDRQRLGWAGIGIIVASGVFPVASLTNSHLMNPRNGPLEWLLLAAAVALWVRIREPASDTSAVPASDRPIASPAAADG